MTDSQMYLAVGLPFLLFLLTFGNSVIQWWGLKDEVKGVKDDIREIKSDIKDLRNEINIKLDLILGKIHEHDVEIALLKQERR